jgi:hypothetical protein
MSKRKSRKDSNPTQHILDDTTPSITQGLAPESVCDRARRLAREKEAADEAKRAEAKIAFLNSLFKPGEYVANDDGTYTICGWIWRVLNPTSAPCLSFNESGPIAYTSAFNMHRGILLRTRYAYNVTQLGDALLEIDAEVAYIDRRYPDTLWGNLKKWLFT